jgi:biopolymer transport protein ExbB
MTLYTYILLQISTPVHHLEGNNLSGLSLLLKGGYLMVPILLLSIISVYLFVERLLYLTQISQTDEKTVSLIREKIKAGQLNEAINLCSLSGQIVPKIYEKGIHRLGSPVRDIESVLENMANMEINKMEKHISTLSAIASIAPMLGFLGTVVGMIKSFYNISITNNISIGIIAGGIYEKMITSACGLLVGIMAYIFVTYLNNQISKTTSSIEHHIMEFLDILYKPTKS